MIKKPHKANVSSECRLLLVAHGALSHILHGSQICIWYLFKKLYATLLLKTTREEIFRCIMKSTVVYKKWLFFDVAKSWYIQTICFQMVSINKITVWHNSKFICSKLRKLCRFKYSCTSNDTPTSWSIDWALT